jgi:beta-phosphoglucomutase-like phosphatase (HAD superfamily)
VAGDDQPASCVIFDDAVRNLAPAKEIGFYTVLVGKQAPADTVDRIIPSLDDLANRMPELWKNGN